MCFRYSGTELDKASLETALSEGPKSILYTKIVTFLTNELRVLCKIDEQVNKIDAPEDSVSFLMELSSFLKELGMCLSMFVTNNKRYII